MRNFVWFCWVSCALFGGLEMGWGEFLRESPGAMGKTGAFVCLFFGVV